MSIYDQDIPLELACRAHAGTSHVPEERGQQEIEQYVGMLTTDYALLEKYATTDEKRATLEAAWTQYHAGFRDKYIALLEAKSRCVSPMIAGPSNFPTAQAAERSLSRDKRFEELSQYREHWLTRIKRDLQPELAPIMAGDSDAIERLQAKLAKAERWQGQMTLANATIRAHAKNGPDAQVAALVALEIPGLTEANAQKLIKPDFAGRIGFADYEISNNGAEIRRLRKRIEAVTKAKATPDTETIGTVARVEESLIDNRVRLFFDGKPDLEIRVRLRAAGFRWSPTIAAWQAPHNHKSRALALEIAQPIQPEQLEQTP